MEEDGTNQTRADDLVDLLRWRDRERERERKGDDEGATGWRKSADQPDHV